VQAWGCAVSRRILVLILSAIAIPATAQTFGFSVRAPAACLPVGNAMYRLAAPGTQAEYTVRIDPAAPAPDVRIHLAESPDEADFVLVDDDGEAPHGCHGAAIRSVMIDAATSTPDLVVGLSADPASADTRIYVRSHAFAPESAAALLATAHLAGRRHGRVANHSN
jgi:hypothetical protein